MPRTAATIPGIVTLALFLGGCAIKPEPATETDVLETAQKDVEEIQKRQPEPSAPLTLAQAQARAALYNLDHRTEMMKEALKRGQISLAQKDMLPNLAAEAGYDIRNNEDASSSESFITGQESLEPSFSTEKRTATGELRLSWNILDFGVSYYAAQQEADRLLIAKAAREKVLINLMQQVRTAYWRAVAAQIMAEPVRDVLTEARSALKTVQTMLDERLKPPVELLERKRALLTMVQELQSLSERLTFARVDLARLIGLEPGTSYELAVPDHLGTLPALGRETKALELLALQNSTEVASKMYSLRIQRAEARKSMLRLLPGIELRGTANYNSNDFLVHNVWAEAGTTLSAKLLRLLSVGDIRDQNEMREDLAILQRRAAAISTLSKTHLAIRRYRLETENYANARKLAEVERAIADLTGTAAAKNVASKAKRVRTRVRALRARLQRLRTYADAQDAYGKVLASLGLNPVPDRYQEMGIGGLAKQIDRNLAAWRSGDLPDPVQVADSGSTS
jgi:outer membrane protein TolC